MKIILEGKPHSTNTLYRRHGHVIYMTNEGRALKAAYALQAKLQWQGPPLEGDVEVRIWLYFTNRLRRDIDNWHKILLDSFKGIAWRDDSQITDMNVKKRIDERSRIEIEIISTA